MPVAVLHVVGETFDPRTILAGLSLRPYAEFRKGDRCFPNNPTSEKRHKLGGFKCDVSSADGILAEEFRDAITFLKRNYGDLSRLASISEIEAKYIDFAYYQRLNGDTVLVQCDSLPPELLKLVGELGMGIELSLYPMPVETG